MTLDGYSCAFAAPTVFDTSAFAALNADKVEDVRIVATENLAQILGITDDGEARAPFSAPYAQPAIRVGATPDSGEYQELLHKIHAASSHIRLILPPPIYDAHNGLWQKTLHDSGWLCVEDCNFHIPLEDFNNYTQRLTGAAPRNLRRAMAQGFELRLTDDIAGVYDFIAVHHRALGYHMAMTRQGTIDTAPVANSEFFEVLLEGRRVAAAIYDVVTPFSVQLINWGDDLTLRHLRTSSFMAYAIAEYYAGRGFDVLDLGPASTDGVNNDGLVRFKTSLGAIYSPKYTYYKR